MKFYLVFQCSEETDRLFFDRKPMNFKGLAAFDSDKPTPCVYE